jgi:hypothetical protein
MKGIATPFTAKPFSYNSIDLVVIASYAETAVVHRFTKYRLAVFSVLTWLSKDFISMTS